MLCPRSELSHHGLYFSNPGGFQTLGLAQLEILLDSAFDRYCQWLGWWYLVTNGQMQLMLELSSGAGCRFPIPGASSSLDLSAIVLILKPDLEHIRSRLRKSVS
jgi:hypothetical protein